MRSDGEKTEKRRALVIGGSLGGLFVGNMLRRIGWEVDIFERSAHDLDSRGGGVVLQPEVVEVFRALGVDPHEMDLGVRSEHRTVLARDGSIESKAPAPQVQTSWSLIYTTLRAAFDDDHYHQGMTLVEVSQPGADGAAVEARFADGSAWSGDLLVGADGANSRVRETLWPDRGPTYAGYLAWRGLVPEASMPKAAMDSLHGDFAFASAPESHMLGYLVPGDGNDTREGHRDYNWVWYRVADEATLASIMTDRSGRARGYSMPEGELDPVWKEHVRKEAETLLPPAFAAVVRATEEPFAQAIRDLTVDSMVEGRVALVGDAAFVPRPHTAASTSKAAANALALARALKAHPDDIDKALAEWMPNQIALGDHLHRQGRHSGDYLMRRR